MGRERRFAVVRLPIPGAFFLALFQAVTPSVSFFGIGRGFDALFVRVLADGGGGGFQDHEDDQLPWADF